MDKNHSYKGLSDAEVEKSRAEFGDNILTPPPSTPLWRQFLDKFRLQLM